MRTRPGEVVLKMRTRSCPHSFRVEVEVITSDFLGRQGVIFFVVEGDFLGSVASTSARLGLKTSLWIVVKHYTQDKKGKKINTLGYFFTYQDHCQELFVMHAGDGPFFLYVDFLKLYNMVN